MLSSWVAAVAVLSCFSSLGSATFLNDCPKDLECCSKLTRRSLFPRTEDSCPVGVKKCCQEYEKIVKLSGSTGLQCGRKGEKTSSVTVELEKCPTEDQKCVHVSYANVGGTFYKEVHLEIDDVEIGQSSPGRFGFNKYCTIASNGATAECWVPLSVVLTTVYQYGSPHELCNKPIYIATHAAISDGNTCWGVGSPIPDKANNWAMSFKLTFECPEVCRKNCCCPPVQPEEPEKSCPFGTAFGYNPKCPADGVAHCDYYLQKRGCQRWGWWHEVSHDDVKTGYSSVLYANAGQNNLGKGQQVGSATLSAVSGGTQITYTMKPGYGMNEAHVWITCNPIPTWNPPTEKPNPNPCAPGQWAINSGCLTSGSRNTWTYVWPHTCSKYYVMFHAATTTSGVCTPVTCGYVDPADE